MAYSQKRQQQCPDDSPHTMTSSLSTTNPQTTHHVSHSNGFHAVSNRIENHIKCSNQQENSHSSSELQQNRHTIIADVWIFHILPFLPFKYLQHNLFLSKQIMIRGLNSLDLNELSLKELYMMYNLGLLVLDSRPLLERSASALSHHLMENDQSISDTTRFVSLTEMQSSLSSEQHQDSSIETQPQVQCSKSGTHTIDTTSRENELRGESQDQNVRDSTKRRNASSLAHYELMTITQPNTSVCNSCYGELIPISTKRHLRCYRLSESTRKRLDEYSRIMKTVAPLSLRSISEAYHNDKELIMLAVSQDAFILQYLPGKMRHDPDILKVAVETNGFALQFVDEQFQTRELVRKAVTSRGGCLRFAASHWRKDREIVKLALRENGFAFQFLDDCLKEDRDLMLTAVCSNANALSLLPHPLMRDREIVSAAVELDGEALRYAHPSLRKDPHLVRRAVMQNGKALKYADESLTKDKTIVKEAVQQDGTLMKFAHSSLHEDRDLLDSRLTFHFC